MRARTGTGEAGLAGAAAGEVGEMGGEGKRALFVVGEGEDRAE